MKTKGSTRIWSIVALAAGVVVGLSYLLEWLGLSVDGIVRDDVVINDVALTGSDLSSGAVLVVLAAAVGLFALIALSRPSAALGWLAALGGLGAVGYTVYVYLTRDDVFTRAAVDAVAGDDVPAETVERAVDLALRGGVEVLPRLGLFVAGISGLVVLVAGAFMTRRTGVAPVHVGTAPEPEPAAPEPEPAAPEPEPAAPEPEPEPEPRPRGTLGDSWSG